MTNISVIIPAYNEADRILQTVDDILRFKDHKFQIVVVDDGSTDGTTQKLREYVKKKKLKNVKVLRHFYNYGKGFAVKTGLLNSKHRVKLLLDADLSIKVGELYGLEEGYDLSERQLILGYRDVISGLSFTRKLTHYGWRILVRLITKIKNTDTQAPFKILNLPKSFYRELTIDGFAFDVEIIYKARKQGFLIQNFYVNQYNKGKSSVTIKKTIKMFKDLVRIRSN